MKKKFRLSHLYLALVLLVTYLPIAVVVVFSFNDAKLPVAWTGFSWRWYEALLRDGALMEALRNSLILGAAASAFAAVIGTLGAVGLARAHYKSKGMMAYLSTIPIMLPEIILGMVFLAFFSLLRLPFGWTTLILAHTSFCIPYVFLMVKARLVGVDKSIEEAARDLGASPARTFSDITLPLILPAVLSGCILSFAMSFDDVVISIFVSSPTVTTLPIKVYTQLRTGVTPEVNALCTILLIVVILIQIASVALRRTNHTAKEKPL